MNFFKHLLFLIVLGISLSAVAQEVDSVAIHTETSNRKVIQKDYLTIVYKPYGLKTNMAYVSINGEDYQKIKNKRSKISNLYDYNGLIRLLKKYNAEGWELVGRRFDFEEQGDDHLFIMMTRENEEGKN